ncbi:uncharacterized protein LOC143373803 isoform X3 [Andrena cerasifolii]|uniref:uncharacterized protein LOC143373803 isoform X3 n=1 Tax=Andrena cerasifolii TaxID=2819439 RepID=UPI0040376237
MSEIDAKVNMSLDEIIKMEKKEKKKKAGPANGKTGAKRIRGSTRGRSGLRGRGARVKRNVGTAKKEQTWQAGQSNNNSVRGGFVRKRYKKTSGLTRSRSNLNLNQKSNTRGAFNVRRGRGNRFGLTRSRSRTNLTFTQGGFFTNNKTTLKRTNSLPNLRDPTSVHNRLGYQSPAQIAYRNRVKRAKQLLLQRQNQRLSLQNQFRVPQAGKSMLSLQQRSAMERRQQILTSQRRFTTGGLRSDQIARAQRRAQYEQKLMRINTHQRPLPLTPSRNGNAVNSLRQLPRGRSPFRQSVQSLNMVGRSPLFGRQRSRSRSRSRSRTRNTPSSDAGTDVDDRTFSEVMYSLSGNLGVTGRTLNDRFSF